MTGRQPYKKLISDVESSLDKIELEISDISDDILADSKELIDGLVSKFWDNIFQKNHNSQVTEHWQDESRQEQKQNESKQDKIERLKSELDKINSYIETADQTIKFGNSTRSSQEIESLTRSIFALRKRVEKTKNKLEQKALSSNQSNISARNTKNTKQKKNDSWEEITPITFDN